LLPLVHRGVLDGLCGVELVLDADTMDTLGVVEGSKIASTLLACDKALKGADVKLAGLRVAVGLGGRAYFVVFGPQHDVEAALELSNEILEVNDALHRIEMIPRPHPEMVDWLLRKAPFSMGAASMQGRIV